MAVTGFSGLGGYERTTSLISPQSFTACGWASYTSSPGANCQLFHVASATSSPADAIYVYVATDATSFGFFWDGSSASSNNSPVISLSDGDKFFWALAASGSGSGQQTMYARKSTAQTLSSLTASTVFGSWTAAVVKFGNDVNGGPWSGRVWNCKVWDRALTAAELLVESYYERVMYPSSVHAHYRLQHADDLYDYSGQGRTLTKVLTPSTADNGVSLFVPRRRIFLPGAAPTSFTLTAATGTLALTGNATALNQSMAAVTGTLALTGNATAFNETLTAATGTLALTGNAAGLNLSGSPTMVADTGVLTLTGWPATLNWSEAPVGQFPAPAGASGKARRRNLNRRRRYELPNGVHVWATEDEAAQLAEEMLGHEVPVQKIHEARKKAGPVTLPQPDVALESDEIVRPYVRRREIARVDAAFVAYTQRADLADIAFDRLMQRMRRRRRKAAVLLLFS